MHMGDMHMGDTVDPATMGGMGGKDFLLNFVLPCLVIFCNLQNEFCR